MKDKTLNLRQTMIDKPRRSSVDNYFIYDINNNATTVKILSPKMY